MRLGSCRARVEPMRSSRGLQLNAGKELNAGKMRTERQIVEYE